MTSDNEKISHWGGAPGDFHFYLYATDAEPQQDAFWKGGHVRLSHHGISLSRRTNTTAETVTQGIHTFTLENHDKRQPNLLTLVVNLADGPSSIAWTIPSEVSSGHRQVHSIDIYFWTADDCLEFLNHYEQQQAQRAVQQPVEQLAKQIRQAVYNPAAPAAPETLIYREKTPPPVETGISVEPNQSSSTGPATLPNAPGSQYQLPPTTPSTLGYMTRSGHPQPSTYFPPPPNAQHAATQVHTPSVYHPGINPHSPFTPTFPPPQYANHRHDVYDTPLQSPSYAPQPLSSPAPASPQLTLPGTAATSSDSLQRPSAYHAQSHHSSVHQQFYEPTEAELAHGHHGHHKSVAKAQGHDVGGPSKGKQGSDSPPKQSRLEAGLGRLDKGVNKFFKKLERI